MTLDQGARVRIVGGEHFARTGVVADKRTQFHVGCLSIRLDKALPGGRSVVVVEEHLVLPEVDDDPQQP